MGMQHLKRTSCLLSTTRLPFVINRTQLLVRPLCHSARDVEEFADFAKKTTENHDHDSPAAKRLHKKIDHLRKSVPADKGKKDSYKNLEWKNLEEKRHARKAKILAEDSKQEIEKEEQDEFFLEKQESEGYSGKEVLHEDKEAYFMGK